ncbi:MAG: GDP-L-fucose synthase [Candidatus Omnitrophica bacterium]|nr:GDP-L-fucose synthase [Candidatus Omnitrophota bacterium]
MNENSKILVVGHNDGIEKSLFEYFSNNNFSGVFSSSQIGLDTTIQSSVYQFFSEVEPEYVFLGSVCSGGIEANKNNPADFFYKNSESQNNVVYAAQKFGVKKLMYFASSCVYPKDCPQPMKEEYLTTGPMEPTSVAYSTAKLAGIKLCESFRAQYGLNVIVVIPATVYGPGCDVDLSTAHVIGALIHKFYEAKEKDQKEVIVWGTGNARREFIFADDFVRACLTLMKRYDSAPIIHIGSGEDVSIRDLALMIKKVCGFNGEVVFDAAKPEGVMKKLLDNTKILDFGWSPEVTIEEGIKKTFQWYENLRKAEMIT